MSARATAPAARHDLVPASRILTLRGDITEHADGEPGAWGWSNPASPAPVVVGVDVGADAAIAVISDRTVAVREFRFPSLDVASQIGLRGAQQWLRDTLRAMDPWPLWVLVCVEDTFAMAAGRSNPKTKGGLDRRVGALVQSLMDFGPVVRIPPTVWQSAILGKHTRDAGKRASVDVARARFPKLAITSDHESDACLIALFGRRGRMPRSV